MKRYFTNIKDAVVTTSIGFGITFKHLFTKSITLQYPDEKWDLPERSRMRLFMDWDDCIGCLKCARACPVDCIHITTHKVPKNFDALSPTSNGTPRRLFVEQFDIDMSECMYCALCVYPCPESCIYMTPEYEFSVFDREELIYDFVTVPQELQKNVHAAIAEEKKAKEEAMRKKREAQAKKKREEESPQNPKSRDSSQ